MLRLSPVLLVLTIVAACASRDPDRTRLGAKASCHVDSDCTLVTQTNCCSGCPESPRAIPVESEAIRKRQCAETNCKEASDRIECPKVAPSQGYIARCDEGTCAASASR